MLRTADIEMRLIQTESGIFQKVCNEILCKKGYIPYKYTGSVKGSNKTRLGTPDSVFIDSEHKYVYVEITTQQDKIDLKIKDDVEKCLKKIKENSILNDKISKIIFLHNNDNPEEMVTEKIKEMCGNIEFEIYGISYLSYVLQNECQEIAISLLNVKDDSQVINELSQSSIEQLANAINKNNIEEYKNDTSDEIKKKITKMYEEASSIVNTSDAMVYISDDNRQKLKQIYNNLKVFDFYYNNQNKEETQLYYHNMLVIISKSNSLEGIEFYDTIPNFAKSDTMNHFYAIILIGNGKYCKAKEIIEDLYYNKKYENSFETLVRVYFLTDDYDKVIELLSKCRVEKFDRYGFLASMLIIAKNKKKKYTENELIKLNNSKFRKMPLFLSCTAKMLYDINRRNKKYKEQFKKCIKLLNEKDVISIDVICNEAIAMKLEQEVISFLESINLTPVLQNKLLELLSRVGKLTKKQIEFVENINRDSIDKRIDMNYLNGEVCESKGKELESIKFYKDSFEKTSNVIAGCKYIQLSIKNKSKIDENIIRIMSEKNQINSLMLAVDAYNYIGRYNEALKYSYRAIYLSHGNNKQKDIFKQYWYTITLQNEKENKKNDSITKDCAIILRNGNKKKIILLEDEEYFKENNMVANALITRTYSDIGLKLFNLKKGDQIAIDNKNYIIEDVLNKYTYLAQKAFKYIEKDKHIELFTSYNCSAEETIEQIRQKMIEINNSTNKRLDIYQENKCIPLSGLLSRENNFEDYIKLINTLLFNNDRVLLCGETIDINLYNGFVLDISAIIVLTLLDMLDLIPDDFFEKIYITTSLKNKFEYFYEMLVKKQEKTESFLYLTDNEQLLLNETPVIEQIRFWKKLYNYVNKFKVIDIEAERDELLNDKTIGFLDKTQFDLMTLSKKEGLPFISDDLMIRKIANNYGIKHTNSMQLVKCFSKCHNEYISNLIKFSKCNYIYTLYPDTLLEISKELYENFNEENKGKFISIIEAVMENKVSIEYYVPILLERIKNLKGVQYIQMFDIVYENLFASFFINDIYRLIENKCKEKQIDIKEFLPN